MYWEPTATSFPLTALIYQVNILVDQSRHARLADFGLLTIVSDSTTSNSFIQGGTVRWMSPELFGLEIQDHRRTKHSDFYALGMVVYEVLSGRMPFYQYVNLVIPGRVVGGDRPKRPRGTEGVWFTDDVWEVLGRCWNPQPGNRPNIEDVLRCLEKASRSWTPSWLLGVQSEAEKIPSGTYIPQRLYCQGNPIPHGAAGQSIIFAMEDRGYLPAELALSGPWNRLVDRNGTVFTDHHQTINMRIEVFGPFIVFRAAAHSISTSAVAGVQWMGSTGEYHVSQVDRPTEPLPRSGSWTTE